MSARMSGASAARQILERLLQIGIAVVRLENDSRRVQPGDVFIAMAGARSDGRAFIGDAIRRGAAAVLWQNDGFSWPLDLLCPNLPVDDMAGVLGYLADEVYGQPSTRMALIGVTGTNGKTTCTQWLARAFAAAGRPCAVIGTLGNGFPGSLAGSMNTTPDALALHASLAAYRDAGAQACAIEVSSIGLDQQRCNGARFATAIFTNLTRDHLDYHGSMGAYGDAKRRLFAWPGLQTMVVNLDDPFGAGLLASPATARRIGYTTVGAGSEDCDTVLQARDIEYVDAGVRFHIEDGRQHCEITAPVIGRFNVSNLLAVAGGLLASGFDFADLPAALAQLSPPAGRMQRYGGGDEPLVLVDYAHSPDALAAALDALRPVAVARGGHLVCVFGCGGDRDRGKRPLMGEIATRHADRVCLTSDNPRSEDPAAILEEIRGGAPLARVEIDRATAIRTVIAEAAAGDVVLIAGKGHETYQEITGVRHPFSDGGAVKQALAARSGRGMPS